MAQAPSPRLLFASYHGYTDPSSGAAIATGDLLELLAEQGWNTRVLCGPTLDVDRPGSLLQWLSDQQIPYRLGQGVAARTPFSTAHYHQNTIPVAAYLSSQSPGGSPTETEGNVFLALLEQALNEFRPHIVLTYGGSWVSTQIHTRARRRGAKVVFALHNLAYRDARVFSNVDSVLVPSRYAGQWYRSNVGVMCTAIPSALNLSRVECVPDADQRYVTFVNPQPAKGAFVFARIAQELGRRRPDIPLLVVEGRGGVNWLARTGIDLSGLPNLSVMATTPDPRDFYRVSHLVLMPSVGHETFGRVAAESMANGIPVLASDRGALPEVVGDMGLLLKIPDRYTSQTRTAPSAREVEPWVQNIIRLWDDDELYACLSRQCQRAAQKWRADRLGPKYDTYFRQLTHETDPGLA